MSFSDRQPEVSHPSHPELAAEQRYFDHALAHRERRRRRTQESLQNPMGVHAGAAKALREAAKARLEAMGGPDQPVAHGRIDLEDGDTYYIGRYPILDENYDELVISWKTDLAVPFYQASPSNRMGLALKRVFDTEQNRIRDIFDEDYLDPLRGHSVSRDAVLRELERGRSGRLTDIIRTIEAAQDRVMRHPADGALIVQGGPGTGKTVVGLQRTSLLIYRENLEAERLLFVGPSHGFMKYVSQVLPSLGDEAVRQLAIGDLSPIRVGELQKEDDSIAEIKGRAAMLEVLRRAIRDRRNLPVDDTRVVINDQVIVLSLDEVASIVSAHLETERPHNLVRPTIRNEIGRLVNRKLRAPDPSGRRDPAELPASDRIPSSREIDNLLDRLWPTFSPQEFLRDLLASEQRLLAASRGLLDETAARSVARPPQARLVDEPWTLSDMALLDSLQELLNGRSEIPSYAHIVVDEAQDLSPMQLLSLRRRAEGGITLLGDLAQATGAWGHDSWEPVIDVLDYPSTDVVELEVGYRVPAEVMEIAGALVAGLDLPVRVPESIRPVGEPVEFVDASATGLERAAIEATRTYLGQGRSVAIISSEAEVDRLRFALDYEGIDAADGREEMSSTVVVVPARYSKGLEFDAVVVVEPAEIVANAAQGVRELFVALTRTVRNLSIVYKQPLPEGLEDPGAEPRDEVPEETPVPEATPTEIPERESAKTYSIPEVREEHPNAYAPWEKKDEELLVFLLVQGRTVDEMGKMLGRQPGGIRSRLRKLGLVD